MNQKSDPAPSHGDHEHAHGGGCCGGGGAKTPTDQKGAPTDKATPAPTDDGKTKASGCCGG